ncbi:MAG: flagellar basal-body MS-ring/collar protein FliF [Woeseiaceae bacterium]
MDLVKADTVSVPFQGMTALPIIRQLGLLIGLAASIALGVAVVLWMQTPNYTKLPGQLSGQNLTDVISVLERNQISYNVDPSTGTLMVDSTKVNEAKLKLASENLSLNSGHGFEIIDKDQGFGTSSFLQKARYKRALEGELARTISSMRSVQSARVHLALPKESAFIRNKQQATASVFISLIPGYSIEKSQISAITNLVASSIPSLKNSQVTIVDDKGKLLSRTDDENGMLGLTTTQLEYTRNIEQTLVARIERMLIPIVGSGNIRAQVTADVDFTQTESTQESFNPDLPAIRSEQSSEEQSQGASQGGIPGALSNQPPPQATAPEQVNQQVGETVKQGSNRTSRRSTKNYELDKTISHTRHRVGAIKRLSIAVVIDNKISTLAPVAVNENVDPATATASAVQRVPYTQQEITRLTTLVRETVGFSTLRGDSVSVINVPFTKIEIADIPEQPIYEKAWVWDLAKQVLGGLAVLFLIFGVLKPAMKNLAIAPPVIKKVSKNGEDLDEDQLSLSGSGRQEQLEQISGYEDSLQLAQSIASQEPKRVLQVVQNWMGEEGGKP